MARPPIPVFLSVDVEPAAFQLTRNETPEWRGYDAMFEFLERLRSDLARRSGVAPVFGWYFRTDPQIAEVYGRADHVLVTYPGRMARLESQRDYFGVHAHPIRWCEKRRVWIHDFADPAWLAHCTRYSLDAFAHWAKAPALRTRWGAGFLSNEIIEATHECGVKVDLTLEPVAGWGLHASDVATSVDVSPFDGPYTDCRTAPRVPYYPAYHDFRVADGKHGRNLLMVPLSTASVGEPMPWWRRAARQIVRGSSAPEQRDAQMLYLPVEWPSERYYWDLVERQLESMRRPYLSLGIRTDADDLKLAARVRRMLEALLRHPLSERLRFVDPLEVAPSLV